MQSMNSPKPELPEINEEDRTPLVDVLLEMLAWQKKQIDKLEQEILKPKGWRNWDVARSVSLNSDRIAEEA